MSLLGIDVGTSGCKAAVFSKDGWLLASTYEEYDTQRSQPGWAELDALQVWEQIRRVIAEAVRSVADDPVQALSVSSLGEALVPVSSRREILGPSLLNFDARGAEYLPGLGRAITPEQLFWLNGNILGNHYSLTKLLWLKEHQPILYNRADWFLHWSGLVAFMLGADPTVDYSLANRTLLFDLDKADWSTELLEWAQLERSKLPKTVPAGSVIGVVSSSVGRMLGLTPGIPIVSGGHDQCCNSLGCGVIDPGQAMYGMGTYICMTPVFSRRPDPSAMIAQGLNIEHHVVPGQFVSFIYNQGGALVKWFRDTFASAERKEAFTTPSMGGERWYSRLRKGGSGDSLYSLLMSEMPAEMSRVLVLPHFTATGPPYFIADSSGVMAGLHLDTSRGEILKGILESATFYLRECFEKLPEGIAVNDFRAVGGGSQSDAWLQISADILGRPFIRPAIHEAGVLGAAILAGSGSGIFPSLSAGVERMVRLEQTFTPDPARQEQYAQRFEKYKQLYPLLASYLSKLG